MLHMLRRAWSFLLRRRLDGELVEEIALHLELRRRALIDAGMAPAEAEREARRQFGNVMAIREHSRDYWGGATVATFVQDIRLGVRMMRRSPGLCLAVVLTIAFGTGLNGAVFLQLNEAFLRNPDLPGAASLVWLDDGDPRTGGVGYPDYLDYRDRTPGVDLAAFAGGGRMKPANSPDTPQISVVLASGNYFRVLGTSPSLGRTFSPDEDAPPVGTSVAVVSDAYWTREFGRATDVLGRTIDLNSTPFTIVGVMPPGFRGVQPPGMGSGRSPDAWVPIWCQSLLDSRSQALTGRTLWWGLRSVGRRRDGISVAQAREQIRTVAARLDAEYPGERAPRTPWVWGVTEFDARALRGGDAIMLGGGAAATLLVMLIACGNVVGLLLARAAARRHEIAIRLSLGASRARIVRQFLTEGMVLSAAGTLVGLILAGWLTATSSGGSMTSWIDARTAAYALFLVMIATLTTGWLPAIQASKTSPLQADARMPPAGIGRLRACLVGIEVALSLVLLLTAALLLRGVARAAAIDPVLPVDHLLMISMDADRRGYEGERLEAVLREARRRLDAVPGVQSTALASPGPFSGARSSTNVRRGDAPDSSPVQVFLADVSPDFLETAHLPMTRGRWFGEATDDQVVINEALASRLWPNDDPLGRRLTTGDYSRQSHVVAGVVRDAPYAELRHLHQPFLFGPGRTGATFGRTILVRTSGSPASVSRAAVAAVKPLDARLEVTAALPAERIAQDREGNRRMISAAAGMGGLALLIALGGVAAIASQSVAVRTREIGIRMALGARRAHAVALIVRLALTPVAVGVIGGLVFAFFGSRVLVTQLYGVSPLDPLAFAGTAGGLALAGLLAAWLPARRAAGVDPIQSLRSE